MELIDRQRSTPARSWLSRVERRHPIRVDYFSELRSWVQSAILEAEEKKDFEKKGKLLSLLKDLRNRPRMVSATETIRRKE